MDCVKKVQKEQTVVQLLEQAIQIQVFSENIDQINQAKEMYRNAIQAYKFLSSSNELKAQKQSKEKLVLLLIQSPNQENYGYVFYEGSEVIKLLTNLGYKYRLSDKVLNYQLHSDTNDKKDIVGDYVQAIDAALSTNLIEKLTETFQDGAAYWVEHDYSDGTTTYPSPYFSYLLPVDLNMNINNFMEQFINEVFQIVVEKFPLAKNAKFAEFWAHCRPHMSGHQMHFDSDDEGREGVRNPIVSTVIYLTDSIGGPTLVTTQKLKSEKLSEYGWLCYPKKNRLCMFNGEVLHGVIPGKGYTLNKDMRRITLMIAFWADVKQRDEPTKGSCRPWPKQNDQRYTWQQFGKPLELSKSSRTPIDPTFINQIWTDVDPNLNKNVQLNQLSFLPDYRLCYQGF